jgi:hypothetical protein
MARLTRIDLDGGIEPTSCRPTGVESTKRQCTVRSANVNSGANRASSFLSMQKLATLHRFGMAK